METYPKRLIEVDLPIRRISAHARREKSIRHGHISTLHIWWARRPLAACRAVLCAALWPDPLDEHCPQAFRDAAALALCRFAEQVRGDTNLANLCTEETWRRWNRTTPSLLRGDNPASWPDLRLGLLDFIADFANWDASTVPAYLETARLLTHVAHLSLSDPAFGLPALDQGQSLQSQVQGVKAAIEDLPRPLVVDPFAGGGAIPLEALRVGADAFASDLNPVAVLLNKVVLEYIPRYGQRLADEVRKWGQWVKEQAEKELAEFYPKNPDGATPIAYLWARTIQCEGPGCGAEVPLMSGLWLAKTKNRSVALRMISKPEEKRVDFEIIQNAKSKNVAEGTVRRGSATCPLCGYTTPVTAVRGQLRTRQGGAADARLLAVVSIRSGEKGRFYRLPTKKDREAVRRAAAELEQRKQQYVGQLSLAPDESLDLRGIRHTWAMIYGVERWDHVFTPRESLSLVTLSQLLTGLHTRVSDDDFGLGVAVQTCLALVVDRQANTLTSLSRWNTAGEKIEGVFARQALPMIWDFGEGNPFSDATGCFDGALDWVAKICEQEAHLSGGRLAKGQAESANATTHPLPSDSANAVVTDPPYYDAVAYAYLSDFFYGWLRRSLGLVHKDLFSDSQVPKDSEIVVDRPHELSDSEKDIAFYEQELTKAFADQRRVLRPDGVSVVVFASKTTASWEAILQAVVSAGWTITGSWPIDTEMTARIAAQGQARLASSIHLVCRPREHPDGSPHSESVGEWRDVLDELPRRIHEWMPRLAQERVVGADAIFACLGPALEIYSRYAQVEKASGEQVTLKEYLEQVWAAVSREALTMIFEGADATGFEEDARLTAIWFWTLKAAANSHDNDIDRDNQADIADDFDDTAASKPASGYAMEYDAARKLAQGLGVNLSQLSQPGGIVVIKGSVATLTHVSTRAHYLVGAQLSLFGETASAHQIRQKQEPTVRMKGIEQRRMDLLEPSPVPVDDPDMPYLPGLGPIPDSRSLMQRLLENGSTLLDRLHQAMLLHARSQTALLRPFFVETRVGDDARFWTLAQALSALYPSQSDEKRWVDGVLARKKGLGF